MKKKMNGVQRAGYWRGHVVGASKSLRLRATLIGIRNGRRPAKGTPIEEFLDAHEHDEGHDRRLHSWRQAEVIRGLARSHRIDPYRLALGLHDLRLRWQRRR